MLALEAAQLLANVIADALALHEAGEARSLVRCDAGREIGAPVCAFLDWQRAGEVIAALFEPADVTADGRPLFLLPAGLAPPIPRAALPESSEGSGSATSPNLIGRIMGAAHEVFPVSARRHQFLLREIRRCRPVLDRTDGPIPPASLVDMQLLNDQELGAILERVEAERTRWQLSQLEPGVHHAPAPDPASRADRAFASLHHDLDGGS